MKPVLKYIMRAILFYLCVGIIVIQVSSVLRVHGLTDNDYFKQEKNSLDAVYIGSCHFYSAIMPSRVDSIAGTNSYLAGGVNMTAKVMYYYLKATLERQNPKVVFLDAFSFSIYDSYVDEEVLGMCERRNIADLPFMDRFKLVLEELLHRKNFKAIYYLLDISSFHENWTVPEIIGADNRSEDRGWKEYGNEKMDCPDEILSYHCIAFPEDLREEDCYYLEKMLALTQEKDIPVVFVSIPYERNEYEAGQIMTLEAILKKYGIPHIDFTDNHLLEELRFKRGYMNDANHTNRNGAEVISDYIGSYIKQCFG